MNTRIDRTFANLRREGKAGFIAYIAAGDPSVARTVERVDALVAAGVDMIELGLPFSDPLADGRVNQEAADRALRAGADFKSVMSGIRRIRDKHPDLPLILYTYLNPFIVRSFESAATAAAEAGLDGLLLLDLPVEEAVACQRIMKKLGLHMINLVTPTSPDKRIARIVKYAGGFVYCVSRTGVTGRRDQMDQSAKDLVERIRRHTKLPVALGFGVSDAAQAAQAASYADAVVVGSAIVQRFHEADDQPDGYAEAGRWVADLVRAVKSGE